MFCPEGYIVLQRLDSIFRKRALEIYPPLRFDDHEADTDEMERKNNVIKEKRAQEKEDAMHRLLSGCNSLSVCRSDGHILRISPEIIIREPSRKAKVFSGYLFVNKDTWVVDTSRATKWVNRAQMSIAQREGALPFLKKSKELKKASEVQERINSFYSAISKVEPFIPLFEKFNDFSLTISEAEAPQNIADVNDYFNKNTKPLDIDDGFEGQIGRPSKQGAALSSYWKIYPDGHGNLPWKEVARVISTDMGMAVGKDTLRRALGLRQ